jgi:L-lactate dehydrogenase complex protein LldG
MNPKARAAVLGKLRTSLGVDADDAARRDTVTRRLSGHPRGIVPKRGQLAPAARTDLFVAMAEAVQTTVARVASAEEVPESGAAYLRRHNLPQAIRRGDDPRLAGLPWQRTPALEVAAGRSDGHDLAGLSHAFAGIAESGTAILVSGSDNPTTLNFLPDYHIVVVDADDIAGDMESVWDRLREVYGEGEMPRTVNLVTGPSRSADIEQTLLLGAHGPRALHLIVVQPDGPAV